MYIILDFDSTVISVEWLDLLASISLSSNPNKKSILGEIMTITSAGMVGNMSFALSLEKRLSLLQASRANLIQLQDNINDYISPSFVAHKDFFATHKDNIFIVSGWFEEFIFPVTDFLGVDRSKIFANRFVFNEKGLISGCEKTRYTAQDQGKVHAVRQLNLRSNNVVVIWDGFTDYEIKQAWLASVFGVYTENIRRDAVVNKADIVFQDMDAVCEFINL